MANWTNESEAREQIKKLVTEYYHDFKEKKEEYKEGERITYAARVFDEKEMCALTDATLDFWFSLLNSFISLSISAGTLPPEIHTLLNLHTMSIHLFMCQRGFHPNVAFTLLQSSFRKFASCGASFSA